MVSLKKQRYVKVTNWHYIIYNIENNRNFSGMLRVKKTKMLLFLGLGSKKTELFDRSIYLACH